MFSSIFNVMYRLNFLVIVADYSEKDYLILSRNGWTECDYIYRHKTNKNIYQLKEGNMIVDITEDHSLFDINKKQIHTSEIQPTTKLEYFSKDVKGEKTTLTENNIDELVLKTIEEPNAIPVEILNTSKDNQRLFISKFNNLNKKPINIDYFSKKFIAGYNFIIS